MQRQPTAREKMFANHASDKELRYMYKELLQLSSNEPTNLIKIWPEDLNRDFFKRDVGMANRCKIRVLSITHHQGNSKQKYTTPVKVAIIRNAEDNLCWRDVEQRGPLYVVDRDVKWHSRYGRRYGDSSDC